jgi:8-oxo-dGTP pyrophosphatase MutT (NUDIX family)/ribosomal protein S18 acetylase RimI-like enzyme
MPVVVKELSRRDAGAVESLWQAALDARRRHSGLDPITEPTSVLTRPGVFAVGVFGSRQLLSMAVAMPARADDGRSTHNVPGLAHISSVATLPGHWGQGLARRGVEAILAQAARRGYARAQLWTHVDNAGARHLYKSLGFELSGRHRLDDHGEPIVHYLHDLPPIPRVARPAARMICLDPDERILLMRWRDPIDGYQLLEPPGGGIEVGETPYDAVVREWAEETSLPTPRIPGPSTSVAREVVFNGFRSVVDEDFFLGYADRAADPVADAATAVEQTAYLGHVWAHWRDLDTLDDPVEPDLLPVLRRLAPGGPWSA